MWCQPTGVGSLAIPFPLSQGVKWVSISILHEARIFCETWRCGGRELIFTHQLSVFLLPFARLQIARKAEKYSIRTPKNSKTLWPSANYMQTPSKSVTLSRRAKFIYARAKLCRKYKLSLGRSMSFWSRLVTKKNLLLSCERPKKLKLNVTAEKSRNSRKISIIILNPLGEIGIISIYVAVMCQRLPAARTKDIDDVARWTLRYRYGNKRYFPACCTSILPFQHSSETEWVECNDKLRYSFKTRHSTQENPSFKQQYIFKPFVRRRIRFPRIVVQPERLY